MKRHENSWQVQGRREKLPHGPVRIGTERNDLVRQLEWGVCVCVHGKRQSRKIGKDSPAQDSDGDDYWVGNQKGNHVSYVDQNGCSTCSMTERWRRGNGENGASECG